MEILADYFKNVYQTNRVKIVVVIFILINLLAFSFVYTTVFIDEHYFNDLKKASSISKEKENDLKHFFEHGTNNIKALAQSITFTNYLQTKHTEHISDLFLTTVQGDINIMQLRYINRDGIEKIRVDRKRNGNVVIVPEKGLQNKQHRAYFLKAKNLKQNEIKFSNMNLNMENGEVEKPFNPTIRVYTPIYSNNQFNGMLIINYYLKDLLKDIFYATIYNIYLLDSKGYTLSHIEESKSWGFYQSPQITINKLLPEFSSDILNRDTFHNQEVFSRKLQLPMEEDLIMVMQHKRHYIIEKKKEKYEELIILFLICLPFTIFFSLVISRTIKKLKTIIDEKKKYQHTTNEHIKLIDKYIITSKTDLKGRITSVSTAFCEISGYSEKELIGKNHRLLKHPDTSNTIYREMWRKISKGHDWVGEIKNIKKDGTPYWSRMYVSPAYNEKGEKVGYSAVKENITQQKIIEEISIIDELTTIHNKRYFNKIAPRVLQSCKRKDENLTFVIMDIDYFKLYNDTYGHLQGDFVLESVGKLLKKKFAPTHYNCFRVGGEEFIFILKSKDYYNAFSFVESIREDIEDLCIEHKANRASPYVTASIGMVYKNANDIKNIDEIYTETDELLYKAKETGRNRIETNIE